MSGPAGRTATSPARIPARGWRSVLARVGRRVMDERLPLLSAGVAFFAVLSVAPVLVTALSAYGAVHSPDEARAELAALADGLPAQLQPVVEDQLATITAASTRVLTSGGLVALGLALWTATTAMTYLLDALSVAYDEPETRSLARRVGVAVLFVLGGALLLGAVLTAGGAVADGLDAAPPGVAAVGQVVAWLALAALATGVLDVVYRYGPDRRHARWAWISWGAALVTVLWLASTAGLFTFVRTLGTYDTTYGSLAGVAISMFWLLLTVFLVVLGAAVNAEAERQTRRDSTVGADRPRGQRGAVVADEAAGGGPESGTGPATDPGAEPGAQPARVPAASRSLPSTTGSTAPGTNRSS